MLVASTLQVLALVLALVAAGIACLHGVRLARVSARQPDRATWWQNEPARAAIGNAITALWRSSAAIVIGAVLPKFALRMAGT
nr:hypothetical protein [Xanthomonas fragariae]